MLGTIYRWMTFGTVCMRKYMPAVPSERGTLRIDVTVWAHLAVKCVFHLV